MSEEKIDFCIPLFLVHNIELDVKRLIELDDSIVNVKVDRALRDCLDELSYISDNFAV